MSSHGGAARKDRKPRQAPATSVVAYVLTAPIIYGLIAPIALLDAAVWIYQRICFPFWRIPTVDRRRYVILDRHRLPYLNRLQKLNCTYCAYTNGVLAYVTEVAARTEEFFCPIKHRTPPDGRHSRYDTFVPFGDAAGFRERQDRCDEF